MRTHESKAKYFAERNDKLWNRLVSFVRSRSTVGEDRMKCLDGICKIIDGFTMLTSDMLTWCHEKGIDPQEFFSEMYDKTGGDLPDDFFGDRDKEVSPDRRRKAMSIIINAEEG